MSIIKNAKKHYIEKLSEPRKYEVKEWDATIYTFPLTMAQYDQLANAKGSPVEQSVSILMLIARDEDNKPIFTEEDKDTLMNAVDPMVLMELSNRMASDLVPEEVEVKN